MLWDIQLREKLRLRLPRSEQELQQRGLRLFLPQECLWVCLPCGE